MSDPSRGPLNALRALYLDRARRHLAQTVGASVGSRLDAFFVKRAFHTPSRTLSAEAQKKVRDELHEASTHYADVIDDVPPPFDMGHQHARRLGGLRRGELLGMNFASYYHPRHSSFEATLASIPEVKNVSVRWLRHHQPRPALLLLHGWGMGRSEVDARLLRARYLYRRGLDVLLMSAPFHGPRAPSRGRKPAFPSSRPVRAIEGFAMWLTDVAAVAQGLRNVGAPAVGLAGISMGGFASALAATTSIPLDLVAPIIPFADLPGLLWDQAQSLGIDPGAAADVGRQEFVAAFSTIAPLERELRHAGRLHVFGGRYDKVTPVEHARRLSAHFACDYTELESSHLLQLDPTGWSAPVADAMLEAAS